MLNIWQLNWQFGNVLKNRSIGKTSKSMITQLMEMFYNDERATEWIETGFGFRCGNPNELLTWLESNDFELISCWMVFVPITNQPFVDLNQMIYLIYFH